MKTLAEYRADLACGDCGYNASTSLANMTCTRDAYLYVIKADGQSLYKVGVTKDLEARVASLQTGCPFKLKVVTLSEKHPNGVYAAGLEREMHKLLSACRTVGEWFCCEPSVVERAEKEAFVKLYCPPLYARWQRYRLWISSKNLRTRHCKCCGGILIPYAGSPKEFLQKAEEMA